MDEMTSLALKFLGGHSNSDFNMAKTLAEAQRKRPRDRNRFLFREYAMSNWEQHASKCLPLRCEIRTLFLKLLDRKVLNPLAAAKKISALFALAVSVGHISTVETILDFDELDVNEVLYPHGRTALHMAIICGSTEIAILLIQKKSKQINCLIEDHFDKSAIEMAYDKEMFSLLNVLLFLATNEDIKSRVHSGQSVEFKSLSLRTAMVKLPRELSELTNAHSGVLVREVAEERCELEAPLDGLGCYNEESDQGHAEQASRRDLDDFRDGVPSRKDSETLKIRLIEAQLMALNTQDSVPFLYQE